MLEKANVKMPDDQGRERLIAKVMRRRQCGINYRRT